MLGRKLCLSVASVAKKTNYEEHKSSSPQACFLQLEVSFVFTATADLNVIWMSDRGFLLEFRTIYQFEVEMGHVQPSCLYNFPHGLEKVLTEQSMHYFGSGELWPTFTELQHSKAMQNDQKFSSVSSMLTNQRLLILLYFGDRTLWLKGAKRLNLHTTVVKFL